MSTEHKNHIWMLLGISVAIALLILAWWSISTGLLVRNTGSANVSDADNAATTSMTSTNQANELDTLLERLADLNKTTALLKDSVTYLEAKLIRAHVLSDTLIENGEMLVSSQPGQQTELSANESSTESLVQQITKVRAEKPSPTVEATKHIKDHETTGPAASKIHANHNIDSASSEPIGTGNDTRGRWVINLVSFTSQAQAERFMSNANIKGLGTSLRKVNVKGNNYWRVQVSGLKTLEDAKDQGKIIKKQLGLNDIWITKQ